MSQRNRTAVVTATQPSDDTIIALDKSTSMLRDAIGTGRIGDRLDGIKFYSQFARLRQGRFDLELELLNPLVAAVADVEEPPVVQSQAVGPIELAVALSLLAECHQQFALGVVDQNSVVARVGYEESILLVEMDRRRFMARLAGIGQVPA